MKRAIRFAMLCALALLIFSHGVRADAKTLIVYFSHGNTQRVAERIAAQTGADLFRLLPVVPYSEADLDYNDRNSRTSRERADPKLRKVPLVSATVDNWNEYDTVFIGYPIWHGDAAWPVNGFIEANDFTGKTVVPFCTSIASGLGRSAENLKRMAHSGNWQAGKRFPSNVKNDEIDAWLKGLKF